MLQIFFYLLFAGLPRSVFILVYYCLSLYLINTNPGSTDQRETGEYKQITCHFQGDYNSLQQLANQSPGVDLYEIKIFIMKKNLVAAFLFFLIAISNAQTKTITISKQQLSDKIKGGWAGQTIGVTFGGPYEFRFNGTFIGDYQSLKWYDGYLKNTMINNPGLYDDLYMDLTFVDVFEKYGFDAPLDSFANAYANAGYMLWHANQVGRYNIQHGIKAPQSGHWMNNPHADCIDYQIESDFAGLMSPGMPNTASAIRR
jgi:hypothetical protein